MDYKLILRVIDKLLGTPQSVYAMSPVMADQSNDDAFRGETANGLGTVPIFRVDTNDQIVLDQDNHGIRVPGTIGELRLTNVAAITTAGNETYTAAQLILGIITRDPNGASRTDTTDTAVNIISAFQLFNNGDTTRQILLLNQADAAETITLAGGVGVTIVNVAGSQIVPQNGQALIFFRRTSATTVEMYILHS